METTKFNDEVAVGGQPSEQQLQELTQQGFKTVINFRPAGEKEQPLSPDVEGEKAKALGLTYLHVPVSASSLNTQTVDAFRQQYRNLPKPAYAHCKGGTRAGAMMMMHLASEQGISGEEALAQAERMGFKCKQPEMKQFVQQYVDSQKGNA